MALTKVTSGVRTLGTGEVVTANINDGDVTTAKMATDPTNADNLASGSVPVAQLTTIPGANVTGTIPLAALSNAPATDVTGLEDDIALLGFKVASNGSLAKYNLVDQTVDDFQDASGVNAGGSTNEVRNASGKYYSGELEGPAIDGYIETLLHGDGSDSGTTFTDSSSNGFTVSSSGSIVTSTTSPKFGTASIHVPNATSDYIYWGAGSSSLHLDADPWTISFWIKTTHSSGTGKIFGRNNGSGGQHNFDLAINLTSSGLMSVVTNTNTEYASAAQTTTAVNDGSWHHIEFTRSGANIRGFVNGTLEGTTDVTTTSVINRESSAFYLGQMNGGTYNGAICYIDELEFSPGIARHTASFTPPVAAWGGSESVNMTLVSATTAAQEAPTKGDIVLTYTNGAGSTTLDTDLTAEISADGGSTWTALALGSEGSTGSHNIATSHDVTISSTITSPWNMAYRIKTLNQAVGKTTRIQAVSLGWS